MGACTRINAYLYLCAYLCMYMDVFMYLYVYDGVQVGGKMCVRVELLRVCGCVNVSRRNEVKNCVCECEVCCVLRCREYAYANIEML